MFIVIIIVVLCVFMFQVDMFLNGCA